MKTLILYSVWVHRKDAPTGSGSGIEFSVAAPGFGKASGVALLMFLELNSPEVAEQMEVREIVKQGQVGVSL